mmetsp:Transcript_55770/g.107607  ORF Transcript_55770/g.107607 Transcript_55770/m.107607 type:complete len:235 (-) Transcript_55770:13-717(-)
MASSQSFCSVTMLPGVRCFSFSSSSARNCSSLFVNSFCTKNSVASGNAILSCKQPRPFRKSSHIASSVDRRVRMPAVSSSVRPSLAEVALVSAEAEFSATSQPSPSSDGVIMLLPAALENLELLVAASTSDCSWSNDFCKSPTTLSTCDSFVLKSSIEGGALQGFRGTSAPPKSELGSTCGPAAVDKEERRAPKRAETRPQSSGFWSLDTSVWSWLPSFLCAILRPNTQALSSC